MIEPRLSPGQLHGQVHGQLASGGFVVTDGTYAGSAVIDRHDHELASFCVVLAGYYEETFGRRTREVGPGMIVVHPEGEHHSNRHGRARGRIVTVEIEASRMASLREDVHVFDEGWHRRQDALVILAGTLVMEMRHASGDLRLVIESIVTDMLAAADDSRQPDTRGASWLLRVRDYLEDRRGKMASMQELAVIVGCILSTSHARSGGVSGAASVPTPVVCRSLGR